MRIDFSSLGDKKFEELCKQLCYEEYGAEAVNGAGGDDGADSYCGTFNGKVKIWQFKFFCDTLGASQKKQIMDSLETAKKKHILIEWTICLPKQFTPAEIRWFQGLISSKENKKIKIKRWDSIKLHSLLQKHKKVSNEFFEEENTNRLKKIEKYIREQGSIKECEEIIKYTEQLSAFKIDILNIDAKSFFNFLKNNLAVKRGLGFKKFEEDKDNYQVKFLLPRGFSSINITLEEEDNPFQLSLPFYFSFDIWVKNTPATGSIFKTTLTCFTSHEHSKAALIKILKENLPDNCMVIERDFNRKMKGLISDRKKYALSTTTIALDPNIIEKINNEGVDIDVEIRSNIIHSKKGGLPKTNFMQRALKLVKSVRKENAVSEIIFFRAKKTTQVILTKMVTLELHNDGRIRIWFRKNIDKTKKELMIELDSYIDRV